MKYFPCAFIALALFLNSCSPVGETYTASDGDDTQTDAGAADAAAEEEEGGWWQLIDDSVFITTVEPWPPKAGTCTLKAEATMDDFDQKLAGTAEYRISPIEDNSEPWIELPATGEDEHGSILFETPITLEPGTTYIQFRVRDAGEEDYTELTGWTVTVE